MCRKTLLLSIFHILIFINPNVCKAKIYRYIDENGILNFTDVRPTNTDYQTVPIPIIDATEWIKTSFVAKEKLPYKKQRKELIKNEAQSNKKKQCKKLKTQINQIEIQLRNQQKPENFERLKNNLRKLRWTYRKSCLN
ncbi:hypothetical protein [Aliikangiella maris]|uniref:DUF4124 domain-containing protein n=2 Tax=Aliikangiella maris TaxID=3162458 RepID=A0ABV3MJQ9_9GAMM